MHQRTPTLFVTLVLCLALGKAYGSDRWETLKAINLVENPTNQTHVGPKGELGPYQFRVSTWRMHTQKPFNMATDRATADEVAVSHYEWIKSRLETSGVDANSYNIAMAWNCGVTAVISGRIPTASYRYADQVRNLVVSMKDQEQAALAAAKPVPPPAPARPATTVVQFDTDPSKPHFVIPDMNQDPLMVVSAEPARTGFVAPGLVLALASAN